MCGMAASTPDHFAIRRHWGAFRTPWVVRKIFKSARPNARPPEAFGYRGSAAGADEFVARLLSDTGSFTHNAVGVSVDQMPSQPRSRRRKWGRAADAGDPVDLASSGGGVGWFDDLDEFALVIFAIIAVVVVLVIAVPLGLIAVELVLALGLIALGIMARLLNLKPWSVLVRRDGVVVAAVAVKGWRASRAVIAALREHLH